MFSRRVYILLGLFVLAGAVVVARLAQVQIGWHDQFTEQAYTRAGGDHIVDTVRGGIFTRWGTPLARQVPTFGIGILYDRLGNDDWEPVVSALTGTPIADLKATAQDMLDRIDRIQRSVQERSGFDPKENYVRIAEQNQYHCVVDDVSSEVAALIRTEPERFRGMEVMELTRREYPNGGLAPHIVGQVQRLDRDAWEAVTGEHRAWTMGMAVDEVGKRYTLDDVHGVSGIEREYEDELRGTRGYVINRWAFKVLSKELVSKKEAPQPGDNVYLTLREDFQRAANAALARAASPDSGLDFKSGSIVILDVRTGAILAAATWPTYDLDTYRDDLVLDSKDGKLKPRVFVDPLSPILFRPLQAKLPTGSVFKIVTATAGLQTGAITGGTTFESRGSMTIGGHVFHDDAPPGAYSLVRAIEQSCNVYFYNVGLSTASKAGPGAIPEWANRYGLGVPTGVDWPFERTGQVPVPRSKLETVNLSIGQGNLQATPVQVAGMLAAVANGGRLYTPHFLDHACNAAGDVVQSYDVHYTTVPVAPGNLDMIREGLHRVVTSGTARARGLETFDAAGKTGTAETGISKCFYAWFAGYAPFDNPKVAFVAVNERTSGHGGANAAPIVADALLPIWQDVLAMR